MYNTVSRLIAEGNIVGWFQGRMEFGPRALGARSILADPRNREMQSTLNLKIKFRESFRPFAPMVLEPHVGDYFDLSRTSPYMLIVTSIAERIKTPLPGEDSNAGFERIKNIRSELPAITHVDYSARVQTVDKDSDHPIRHLLDAFYAETHCPVLVNTSFNVRGEPIVCTPEEAYICFMRTEMDVLVLNNVILIKSEQPKLEEHDNWQEAFPLD